MNDKNTFTNWQLLLISSLFLLLSNYASADKYYWVNGSGNWSDYQNHWAINSGVQAFHVNSPTPNDTVYFDANSFTALNQAININLPDAYCAAMDWTGALYSPTVITANILNQLTIYGSLTFIPDMKFDFNGKTKFRSNSAGNTISSASQVFKGDVYIEGGEWLLQDSLTTQQTIYFNKGTLTTNNHTLHCKGLYASPAGYTLNLGASTIYATSIDLANNANSHLNAGTSTLVVQSSLSGNFHYNRLIIATDSSNAEIQGTLMDTVEINELIVNKNKTDNDIMYIRPIAKVHKAVFLGDVYTTQACVFDSLELSSSAKFILSSGKTQTIHYLSSTGNYKAPITITSGIDGEQGIILFTQDSLCLDYLQLKDVKASGTGPFYAGYHSVDNGNNTGWTFESCVQPISNVWPGDANADGVANYLDLLYIGMAYGETGPLRPNASLAWEAQPVLDWKSAFLNEVNTKNADCDGSGTIDATDTVAVLRNYSEVHNKTQHTLKTSSADPLLHLILPASLQKAQAVTIPILLGTTDIPATDAYGLGFSLNYDPLIIDSASEFSLLFFSFKFRFVCPSEGIFLPCSSDASFK